MNLTGKVFGFMLLSIMASGIYSSTVLAEDSAEVELETRTVLAVHVDAPLVSVYTEADTSSDVAVRMNRGEISEVIEQGEDGWLKIDTGVEEGYIMTDKAVTLLEFAREFANKAALQRRQVASYAVQFVGNRYVYGGSDPNTGVDCSGFTSYVMQHAAGISLPHSSTAQASCGRAVSYEEVLPGDLLFYADKNRINHVAIYIGDDQVVHASTAKTGIKISAATYRNPVKIVRVLES